jgi:hypothetical protein
MDRKEGSATDSHVADELEANSQPTVGGVVVEIGARKGVVEVARRLEKLLVSVEGANGREVVDITLCMCVCVCIYIYIYIYISVEGANGPEAVDIIYICIHTHTHTHTHNGIYIYIYIL